MPFYTAITQEDTIAVEKKAKIAEEIIRIQTSVMKVPKNFVRVVFLSHRRGQDLPVEGRPLRPCKRSDTNRAACRRCSN